jgi:long-subunit acyl-CoA synthetase (AMP-forming)
MGAAPRIFEKAHARILATIEQQGELKKRIFHWAIGVGLEMSRARQAVAATDRAAQARRQTGVLDHP